VPHITRWEDKGIYWQFNGDVSFEEIMETTTELFGDYRLDDTKYFIWNMTDVNSIKMEEEEVIYPVAEAKGVSTYKTSMKGALVANDKYARKLIQRYIDTSLTIDNTWELKLFNNIEDARNWISS
jgi:hypothetical protein